MGGGFAGVEAARYLDRTVAKRSDVEVTLVSRENFSLFTPMVNLGKKQRQTLRKMVIDMVSDIIDYISSSRFKKCTN